MTEGAQARRGRLASQRGVSRGGRKIEPHGKLGFMTSSLGRPVYWSVERRRISRFDEQRGLLTLEEYRALHSAEEWMHA